MISDTCTWFFFLNMGTLISQDPLSTFSFIDILTSCHAFNKNSLKTVSIDGWGHRCGEQSIFINRGEKNNLIEDTIFQVRMCYPVWLLRKKQEYSWYRKKRVANTLISFKKKEFGWHGLWQRSSCCGVQGGREELLHVQGQERWPWEEISAVKRKFDLAVQNEAGQKLTEFCQENALVIANTLFH